MVVRLSSKGQLVIPGAIRKRLRLQPGQTFDVTVSEGAIVLQPLPLDQVPTVSAVLDQLQGSCKTGPNLLDALEAEHRAELARDKARIRFR